MTTNREWLYSLDVADLSDWFDAEHVDEHADELKATRHAHAQAEHENVILRERISRAANLVDELARCLRT